MGRFIDDTDAIVLSEPVERFVDLVLTPTMLTTAPFYDPTSSGPGLVLVPAPGAGKVVIVRQFVTASEQTKAGWGTDPNFFVAWNGPSGRDALLGNGSFSATGMDKASPYPQVTIVPSNAGSHDNEVFSDVENRPITASISYDLTDFALSVTAVNQGTKTFTFLGAVNLFTPGSSFAINGSTGNDGTYTVVSSSTNNDLTNPVTVVVVSQAIPSAVADGFASLTGLGTRRLFTRCYYVVVPTRAF